MNKPPWYPHYAQDWLAGTAHLSLECQGAYKRLTDHQWIDGPLPNDPRRMARLLGVSEKRFASLWRDLAEHFPAAPDGRLANPRLERERAARIAYQEIQHRKGLASAEARASLNPGSTGVQPTYQPEGNCSQSQSQTTTTLPDDARPTEAERIVRDSLQTPEYVQAFERLLRAAQKPGSLAASIRGFGPGGIHACATWPELGHALMDLAGAPGLATPAALKAFIRRIQQGDPPPSQGGNGHRPTAMERNLAVVNSILAEEEAKRGQS